jgi:plastocyanin
MDENKKTVGWVIGGVVLGVVVIYFVVTGGINLSSTPSFEGEETPQGTVVAPGTSAISGSGQVVTPSGAPVRQDVEPGSPEAPQQSAPLSESEIPSQAVKLEMSAAGFSPSQFTVDAGDPVVLSITSADDQTHVFYFDDPELQAVAVGVGPGETRVISFNVPSARGEYGFHCDVPGHAARGEVGVMVVE